MRSVEPLLLRVQTIWGSTDRIGAKPDLTVHENVVYLPADAAIHHRLVPAHAGGSGIEMAPDGFYILLNNTAAHYGHFIVDVLSCIWPALNEPKSPVRLLCESTDTLTIWEQCPFIGEILAGLDLSLEAVVSFETPVVLPRVAVAAPSFVSLSHFHDVFGDLCRQAGRRYWNETEVDTVARPAYLAKTRLTSGMHSLINEEEVATELDRLGVDILFPETMSFAEQVREFARRRVLMGPVGSAFHTAVFSAPQRRTIGLSAMLHLNSNYLMFDAINGNRAYYYYVSGMRHGKRDGFGLAWTVPRPKAVAAAMLKRAENFDRIDAYDDGARRWRGLTDRAERWRDHISARWRRLRPRSDRQPP